MRLLTLTALITVALFGAAGRHRPTVAGQERAPAGIDVARKMPPDDPDPKKPKRLVHSALFAFHTPTV